MVLTGIPLQKKRGLSAYSPARSLLCVSAKIETLKEAPNGKRET